jgi:hypothetical protein
MFEGASDFSLSRRISLIVRVHSGRGWMIPNSNTAARATVSGSRSKALTWPASKRLHDDLRKISSPGSRTGFVYSIFIQRCRMNRAFHLLIGLALPLLAMAQTLVPLPPAGSIRPGEDFGVISGKLSDKDGLPVAQALLEAARFRWSPGGDITSEGRHFFGRTDDRGRFRISVQPGRLHLLSWAVHENRGEAGTRSSIFRGLLKSPPPPPTTTTSACPAPVSGR